jgi:hypothetical protein
MWRDGHGQLLPELVRSAARHGAACWSGSGSTTLAISTTIYICSVPSGDDGRLWQRLDHD